jgi:hypothetical protein
MGEEQNSKYLGLCDTFEKLGPLTTRPRFSNSMYPNFLLSLPKKLLFSRLSLNLIKRDIFS